MERGTFEGYDGVGITMKPNLANVFVIELSSIFSDSRSCLVITLYFLSSCLLFESVIWGDSC